jgi:RNA polymerase sigma factor (sigma-70 family)
VAASNTTPQTGISPIEKIFAVIARFEALRTWEARKRGIELRPPTVNGRCAVTIVEKARTEAAMASKAFLIQVLEVFLKYGPTIMQIFVKRGLSRQDAEDLMNDLYVIMRKADEESIRDLTRYLFGVARHLLKRFRRERKRHDETLQQAVGDEHAPSALDEVLEHPDEQQITRELLEKALKTLNRKIKEVYLCVERDGMTYEATAQHCSLPVWKVEKFLTKARRKMRARMAPHLGKDLP